jgi:hypothetical protein
MPFSGSQATPPSPKVDRLALLPETSTVSPLQANHTPSESRQQLATLEALKSYAGFFALPHRFIQEQKK